MTNNDRIISTIRTFVPALIGLLIARLVAAVPAVADVIAWLDSELGTETTKVIGLVAAALVIAAYYWLVRRLATRWPWLEAFLGSTKTPIEYVTLTRGDDGIYRKY